MTQASGRTVFMLGERFSAESGGRTRAYLERARILAEAGTRSYILTFNLRQDYELVFDAWRTRLGLDDRIEFHNIWQWHAGETLSGRLEPAGPFTPCDGDFRYVERIHAWKYFEKGKRRRIYSLNEDGTLHHTNFYDENLVKLRRDMHAADGHVYLRTTFVENAAKDDDDPSIDTMEYLTPEGRTYLVCRPNGEEQTFTVLDRQGEVVADYPDRHHFRSAWVAQLAEAHPEAVFISDVRRLDPLLIDNPYRSFPRTVAAVHSSHLETPFDDPHKMIGDNNVAFERAAELGAVVVLTHQQKDDVETHYGSIPNLVVIPHAIKAPTALIPRRRGQDVVAVTRFHPIKQLDQLVRAFVSVRARVPAARLQLWGSGVEEPALRELVTELELDEGVSFRGYTKEVAAAFASGRVTASTSLTEGFGLSTIEALAAGTPVVSYDYRYGPRELIEPGVNGALVEKGDIDALADALVEILLSPTKQWREMSAAAKRSVSTYDESTLRARWLALFDHLG